MKKNSLLTHSRIAPLKNQIAPLWDVRPTLGNTDVTVILQVFTSCSFQLDLDICYFNYVQF